MVRFKGQLTIQYLISFTLFIGIIAYIYLLYSGNIPNFIEESKKEVTRSEAYQLSEILVNNPGEPIDWGIPNPPIKRLGFSDENYNETNLISNEKIDALKNDPNYRDKYDCTTDEGYSNVQEIVGLNKPFSFYISNVSIDDGTRDLMLSCFPPAAIKTSINTTIRRVTAMSVGGEIQLAEIIVQI